jgi:hypothetical protein
MSILITTETISIIYFIFPENLSDNSVFIGLIIIIDIFYPSGELILLHQLCCSPFAVVHYSFMGHFLAAAAISTREEFRLIRKVRKIPIRCNKSCFIVSNSLREVQVSSGT